MIPRTVPTWQSQSWQEQLMNLVQDWEELCQILQLSPDDLPHLDGKSFADACKLFPLRVPRQYLQRICKGDPNDPLLLQILPQAQELLSAPGFSADPLLETQKDPASANGIIQKYRSRVLLIISGACAIHCRYCFRRHFPYQEHRLSKNQWQNILQTVAQDTGVNEIILSGGDPLSASDRFMAWLVEQIQQLPAITTLRIHTRLPVVIPERLDTDLLDWMRQSPRLHKVMVLHCNHANEISSELAVGVAKLRALGVHVFNQSVLLKHINDDADTLANLSEKLFQIGVLPYYLHLLDRVRGTHHFEVGEERALAIHKALQLRLPGYLVPKLAREIPGEPSKTVLA